MDQLSKDLRVLLAPNPSPLTGPGTNTFLLGHEHVAVIDPGPAIPSHIDAILEAAGSRITHILVTHAHLDHSAAAPALQQATGAPILAFGDALAGRSAVMTRLAEEGSVAGGEGLDLDFRPDEQLLDGAMIETPEWRLSALHTPGHSANHLSFQWHDTIFCGDLVMGWSTTLISPPDGDLSDFLHSVGRLQERAPARLLPAHGAAIDEPAIRMAELAAHRHERTAQILAALLDGPARAPELAARIYDVPAHLMPAATRNVLAHLIALTQIGSVAPEGENLASARFSLS